MTQYKIRPYRQGEGDFWTRMGPFLVDPKVIKEFGGAIASPPETTWWLAADETGKTVGFGAVEVTGYNARLRFGYAVPEARKQNLYRQLLEARLVACREAKVRVVRADVKATNLQDYLDIGFKVTSKQGAFNKVEWRLGVQ